MTNDIREKRRIMLISNSFSHGQGYLEHCRSEIVAFMCGCQEVLFIPYASKDWDGYTTSARQGFERFGVSATGIHETPDPVAAVMGAQAIFVGGGNTFRLLDTMYRQNGLLNIIRARVNAGMPYLGSSAGSNLACPTIKTTNDMPIVQPPSFDALNLVPFQINPHYIDADPASKHMGETRDKRIAEFHEENLTTVIGLREGAWITVINGVAMLGGTTGAKIFLHGAQPTEWSGTMNLWP